MDAIYLFYGSLDVLRVGYNNLHKLVTMIDTANDKSPIYQKANGVGVGVFSPPRFLQYSVLTKLASFFLGFPSLSLSYLPCVRSGNVWAPETVLEMQNIFKTGLCSAAWHLFIFLKKRIFKETGGHGALQVSREVAQA